MTENILCQQCFLLATYILLRRFYVLIKYLKELTIYRLYLQMSRVSQIVTKSHGTDVSITSLHRLPTQATGSIKIDIRHCIME